MFIIWKRLGWTVPVLSLSVMVGTEVAVEHFFESDNYYQLNAWPTYLAASILAIVVGQLGYLLNHKLRTPYIDETTGITERAPEHTFFFIPIEFWGVIIPIILVTFGYLNQQDRKQEMSYIQNPVHGDVYIVDFTMVFTDADETHKFGIMRVESISTNEVAIKTGKYVYDRDNGPLEDIKNNNTENEGYFSDQTINFSIEEILNLYKLGAIHDVMGKQR